MPSKKRNTTPSNPPPNYSDIWHVDIGYGPTTAIGGIRYCLMLVDKATRCRMVYPLKNLDTSILRVFRKFTNEVGTKPTLIHTDYDTKLMGG